MSATQVNEKAPARTWVVVVLLVLAAVVGAGTAAFVYALGVEYGPTTGDWIDGAMTGLTGAAVPLLLVAVLATVAFLLGRHTTWARVTAVAFVVVSVGSVLVAGGQAAVAKYDRLAKVPFCGTAAESSLTGARVAAAEFARLEHAEPFGGGWYGVDGCGSNVLNVTFAQAAEHYRAHLPAAGWRITRDDSSELVASKADLTFGLSESCGMVEIEIRLAGTTSPNRC
jgi:hypothetical protein